VDQAYEALVNQLRTALGAFLQGRFSAIGATLIAYGVFAALRAVSFLVTDREKVRRVEAEIRSWEERRRKAVEARDTRLYERVLREKSRVDRLKRELEAERLKASVAALVAWVAFFKVLWDAVGSLPVVDVPLPWGYARATFAAWFVANSFWAGAILDRAARGLAALSERRAR